MSRGFTIIEIMMVIVILGIFAALAAPSMADLLASTAVRGASSDFYASLAAARSEAIKRRANAVVAPVGSTWNTGWTVKVSGNTFQQVDALKPRVVVEPATPTAITYGSNGRLISGSAAQTIKFSDSVRTGVPKRCVSVDTNGLPRVRTGC
jgi:type IV fimbrial biogenesis protein FimU